MSIISSIPSGTMRTTSDRVNSVAAAAILDATSPPVTPPSKSSGPNARSASQSSLPSPPPSSSSRHSRTVDPDQDDQDQRNGIEDNDHTNQHSQSSIEKIARRLPSSTTTTTTITKTSTGKKTSSSGTTITTHSSSSSTSSLTSSSQQYPKHVSVAKTKTLGHLTRSTSSEVDNEVANALASGRSIVSKTDWKEEDAQYLVQLIEAQFPKGNIIWDWVGHQMVDRGFTKSQCRSKWKRIRTKVLHGDGGPQAKDKDQAAQEQEMDELHEEDYEEQQPGDLPPPTMKWQHRQEADEISASQSHSVRSNVAYDQDGSQQPALSRSPDFQRPQLAFRSSGPLPERRPQYAYRTGLTAREEEERAAARRAQETEHWSDDEERRQGHDNYLQPAKRFSDYPDKDRSQTNDSPSRSPQQNRRTSSSNHQASAQGDDAARSSTALSAIAAPPAIFGKIEWKPEDSDYLVHLIETKFASRKVDWAYVSKQMEGRGYDRTQCKSRWWRVQHRQNQSQQSQGGNGSISSPSSRGGRPRKSIDRRELPQEYDQMEDEKDKVSETEETLPPQEFHRQQQLDPVTMRSPSSPPQPPQPHPHPSDSIDSQGHYPQESSHHELQDDDDSQGTVDDHGRSPRATRGHEHQKHIEWKEEDSQYMFRMIEREFPVGNVVWSVIGERMQSRGYSQTQCMSKWRRHLKNSKNSNDSNGARPVGLSMDLDVDMEIDSSPSYNAHRENRLTGFRRPRKEDLLIYGDNRGSNGGEHHSGGKRLKSDGVESRGYDREEYRSPITPLDARLVEMEFDRYFNVGNKRRRTIEGEGHDHGPYAGPESAANGYYERGVSSSYEDESAHYRHRHHDRRVSGEMHHEDYPRRSSYRTDEHASSGGYGERETSRRRSAPLADEGAVVGGAVPAAGSAGSAGTFAPERDSHNGERQGRRYDEREWDSAMVVDNEREEPPLSSKSQHREPHSSRSHYANGRYYYDEREPTRATLDQNKEARHRPQEPAQYNEPIGRSPDRGLVGTTHIPPSSSSSTYPNGVSSGGYRDREPVSRRGEEEEEYDPVERDERHYRDQLQHQRHRSHQHQPQQQHHARRPSSPDRGGRDDGGRNGGYRDDKRRYRQSSAGYDHRQDYGYQQSSSSYSNSRGGQFHDRDGDYVDYAMEDDLDWANGRWEGRDMARLAAAVARQGRRWDAIRAQIQIPILVGAYDDQEYGDIYEGFRFEPPTSSLSSVDRHHSRNHHRHSSSTASQSQQRYSPYSQPQQRHQRQQSYQQSSREDGRKASSSLYKTHRPSSSVPTAAAAPATVDNNGYSQCQVPSPSMSSPSARRPSGVIASVSYSRNDAIAAAGLSSSGGAPRERMSPSAGAAVVVIDDEEEAVMREHQPVRSENRLQSGEQDEIVDVVSMEQGEGEGEAVMTMAENPMEDVKEVVVMVEEEESRTLQVEPMEEVVMAVEVSNDNNKSEVDAEIMQSQEDVTAATIITATTTTTTTTTEQEVEALAMH
ncbi:hypothetical protein BGX23_005993 [Mortierella sp. AD031]|nr:hypothetical protein BGX23_005993 [Mortierella sp. AD031]